MTRPGVRLRALAARVCDVSIMERLIDPVIADLQCEYVEALRDGRRWRSRWMWVAGISAFWRVMAIVAIRRAIDAPCDWLATEDGAVGRTIGFTAAITAAAVVIVLNVPDAGASMKAMLARRQGATAMLYLIPPAFPFAIAVGVLGGVLLGMRGHSVTAPLRRAALTLGFGATVASFVMSAWIIPASSQAFHVATSGIPAQPVRKEHYELSLSELHREIDGLNEAGLRASFRARDATWVYELRFALSVVPLLFGWCALGLVEIGHGQRSRLAAGAVGVVTAFCYYLLLWAARVAFLQGWGTALVWMPDLVFLLGTCTLLKTRAGRQDGPAAL
jgi:hypothetical protein